MKNKTANQGTNTTAVKPSREFDYIYDPIFSLSSSKDKERITYQAQKSSYDVLPYFSNMFATGLNYQTLEIRPHHRIPHEAAEVSYMPVVGSSGLQKEPAVQVGGTDRWKFFRRPLVPFLSNFIYVKRERVRPQTSQKAQESINARAESPMVKSTYTQTLYRESEAQTDPYSPDYVLPIDATTQPDILALATLTYGQGLPVGPTELEMIERARAKRIWESSLPPITDAESFEKRLKLMEQMELKEWAYRETEIKRLQEARLDILKKVIRKRETDIEQINSERMEKLWQKKLQEREILKERIQRKKAKILRKLAEKRKNPENKLARRDIIAEYADYGSKVYAPKMREGMQNETMGGQIPPTNKLLQDIDLDKALNLVDAPFDFKPQSKKEMYSITARKEQHIQNQLKLINERIREQQMSREADDSERPLRFLVKIVKPIKRPPTPAVDQVDPIEETKEIAAIIVQRLLRGRSSQLRMYQGKERRMHLIHELRARKAIDSSETVLVQTEKAKQSDIVIANSAEALFDANIQADYVGRALDFLSKEIVRLREERRICAMVKLAERTRRLREQEELGRRQQELQVRAREDLIFSQLMDIHQQTVDTYLEDIVMESLSLTSSQQARQHVRVMADKMSAVIEQAVDPAQENANELAVADLMAGFLIPEVERATLRDEVAHSQKKYLLAAHDTVYGALSTVVQALKTDSHE